MLYNKFILFKVLKMTLNDPFNDPKTNETRSVTSLVTREYLGRKLYIIKSFMNLYLQTNTETMEEHPNVWPNVV